MIRIVFIGCVESSEHLLKSVLQVPEAQVVGVVTRRESSFNSDFRSLEPIATEREIPCFFADDNQEEQMSAWIRNRSPDVGYCFGWSYLLKPALLDIPELGFVGYHPTDLPRNRGRHPIIWALVLGLTETASTFFFMDEGADTGDILSQVPVQIHEDDDARSLYDRLMEAARAQVQSFTPKLAKGTFTRTPQDDSAANTWRKRSKEDGEIDWRMSSRSIYNLIRALTQPYPGAHCVVDGSEIKVWSSNIVDDEFEGVSHLEPGKVLDASTERICVKCGEGVIALDEHEFDALPASGEYLR